APVLNSALFHSPQGMMIYSLTLELIVFCIFLEMLKKIRNLYLIQAVLSYAGAKILSVLFFEVFTGRADIYSFGSLYLSFLVTALPGLAVLFFLTLAVQSMKKSR
ncbi:MAG: hypothetical protein HQL27_10000, partial [Candidatus Omnitrophica bacterium]|nr:hypothetical protein [Candidatus Omnitrophota bacterium]